MIKFACCDDDKGFLFKIKTCFKNYLATSDNNFEMYFYEGASYLIHDIEDGKHFDVIFSDIEMPDGSGMEIIPTIKSFLPEALFVFVTDHLQYAVDSFELNIFRYIPKAEFDNRINTTLNDLLKILNLQSGESYLFESANHMEKIPLKSILYISKSGKNCEFHLIGDRTLTQRISINRVYKTINSKDFLFSDRGNIVNLINIKNIKRYSILLNNNREICVSVSRYDEIRAAIYKLWKGFVQ